MLGERGKGVGELGLRGQLPNKAEKDIHPRAGPADALQGIPMGPYLLYRALNYEPPF